MKKMTNETEIKAKLALITHRSWTDEAFREQLKNDPESVIKEYDLQAGEGVKINFIVDTPKEKYFPIPLKPAATADLLRNGLDEELISLSRLHSEVTCTTNWVRGESGV